MNAARFEMKRNTAVWVLACVGSALSGYVLAAEYHVTQQGADTNDGVSPATALRTIQKGVDTLAPGDVLTIGPGEYRESVYRAGLGADDRDTTIRAALPGSVLLRGDVAAPAFDKVDGYRFVYSAPFDTEPQALMEVDTLSVIEKRVDIPNLEFEPGTFVYDAARKRLYVSTSDMRAPASHHITVCITPTCGLRLDDARRVTVDGLAATGYYLATPNWHRYYVWGIRLDHPVGCVIRRCVAYLNAGGIGVWGNGHGNVIEDCTAYGNHSQFQDTSGNIVRFGGDRDTIRNCYAYRSANKGISFYGEGRGPVLHEHNLGWGNALFDIRIKGHGTNGPARATRCVALGECMVYDIENCLLGRNGYRTNNRFPPGNVLLRHYGQTQHREFADPDNLDFRLQSGSTLRGAGPDGSDLGPHPYRADLFYVRPDGDDTHDGTSVERAWGTLAHAIRTLREGDTLYLEPGAYTGDVVVAATGLDVRGRGREPAVMRGEWTFAGGTESRLTRLTFAGTSTITNGRALTFENCTFTGLRAAGTAATEFRHCVFAQKPRFTQCSDLRLAGNLYAAGLTLEESTITWSDYNAYPGGTELQDANSIVCEPILDVTNGLTVVRNREAFAGRGPLGTAIGIHAPYRPEPAKWAGPFLHSVGAGSANIEWWTAQSAICELGWGETPACTNARQRIEANGYASFSMTGLQPGRTYHFTLRTITPAANNFNVNLVGVAPNATLTFETLAVAPAPVTYHVVPDGDDGADGRGRKTAWRTINRAARSVGAGGTVLLAGGVYQERVTIRASGEEGRPITFKAMPGEKVLFDGVNRSLCEAFLLSGKQHIALDGFYFKGHRHRGWSGVFRLVNSDHVRITRCFWDGRGPGTPNLFLYTDACRDVLVKNCVILNGFFGMYIVNTDLCLENIVNMRNWITAMHAPGGGDIRHIVQKDSIITDSTPFKVGVHLYEVGTSAEFFDANNCYYLRLPDGERKMFLFYGDPDVRHFPELKDRRISLAEYARKIRPTDSFVANPMFRATVGMDDTGKMGRYAPEILVDRLIEKQDLDFPDLFATHPTVVARGIGLQPAAFADFHFNRTEAGTMPASK